VSASGTLAVVVDNIPPGFPVRCSRTRVGCRQRNAQIRQDWRKFGDVDQSANPDGAKLADCSPVDCQIGLSVQSGRAFAIGYDAIRFVVSPVDPPPRPLFLLAEERGKHFRRVLKELNAQGIEPAFDLKKIGARFYSRRNVTPDSH
jgi:hypothetical protein